MGGRFEGESQHQRQRERVCRKERVKEGSHIPMEKEGNVALFEHTLGVQKKISNCEQILTVA